MKELDQVEKEFNEFKNNVLTQIKKNIESLSELKDELANITFDNLIPARIEPILNLINKSDVLDFVEDYELEAICDERQTIIEYWEKYNNTPCNPDPLQTMKTLRNEEFEKSDLNRPF